MRLNTLGLAFLLVSLSMTPLRGDSLWSLPSFPNGQFSNIESQIQDRIDDAFSQIPSSIPNVSIPDVPKFEFPSDINEIVNKAQSRAQEHIDEALSRIGQDVPKFDFPKIDIPKIDLPKVEIPKIDIPEFDVPKFDPPVVNVPTFDIPSDIQDAIAGVQDRIDDALSHGGDNDPDFPDFPNIPSIDLPSSIQDVFERIDEQVESADGRVADAIDEIEDVIEQAQSHNNGVEDSLDSILASLTDAVENAVPMHPEFPNDLIASISQQYATLPAEAGASAPISNPEPSGVVLAGFALLALLVFSRRLQRMAVGHGL